MMAYINLKNNFLYFIYFRNKLQYSRKFERRNINFLKLRLEDILRVRFEFSFNYILRVGEFHECMHTFIHFCTVTRYSRIHRMCSMRMQPRGIFKVLSKTFEQLYKNLILSWINVV